MEQQTNGLLSPRENEEQMKYEKIWIDIAIAMVNSETTLKKQSVVEWSDYILDEYKKRFI